jgi:general secretion pathway protein J
MRFNGKPAQTTGFTLVELLLAITLMSILLGLTYSGLRAATRSTQSGEIILAANGKMRAAHQFVHRQLNQMLPLAFGVTDDANESRIVFTGDSRSIRYVAPMPGYLGSGGPQVQLLELANSNDGGVLQISHALLQSFEQANLYDQEPVILLEDIESAGFEFLGRNQEGILKDWSSNWNQPDQLPVAVRLSIEFSEDVQVQWPVLVAGVRVDDLFFKSKTREISTYELKIKEMIQGKDTAD